MGFEEKEYGSVSTGLADRKLMRFYPVLRNSYFEIINLVPTPLGGRYTGNSSRGSACAARHKDPRRELRRQLAQRLRLRWKIDTAEVFDIIGLRIKLYQTSAHGVSGNGYSTTP